MTTAQPDAIGPSRDHALAAVAAFEAAPIGVAWAELDAHAASAIEALRGHARAALFPQAISPVDASVFAMFELLMEREGPIEHLIADAHARSLRSYPALAAFLRSPVVMSRVRSRAVNRAIAAGHRASHPMVDQVVGDVEAALARQVAGTTEFEPAASALAEDVPALTARLAKSREQREAFARAEAERITEDLQAADRAVQHAELEKRNELHGFFADRAPRVFSLPNGRLATGAAIASIVKGSAAYDITGDMMTAPVELSALDLVRLETEAAEAVRATAARP